jgi:hypothetical protein
MLWHHLRTEGSQGHHGTWGKRHHDLSCPTLLSHAHLCLPLAKPNRDRGQIVGAGRVDRWDQGRRTRARHPLVSAERLWSVRRQDRWTFLSTWGDTNPTRGLNLPCPIKSLEHPRHSVPSYGCSLMAHGSTPKTPQLKPLYRRDICPFVSPQHCCQEPRHGANLGGHPWKHGAHTVVHRPRRLSPGYSADTKMWGCPGPLKSPLTRKKVCHVLSTDARLLESAEGWLYLLGQFFGHAVSLHASFTLRPALQDGSLIRAQLCWPGLRILQNPLALLAVSPSCNFKF